MCFSKVSLNSEIGISNSHSLINVLRYVKVFFKLLYKDYLESCDVLYANSLNLNILKQNIV